jgi:hypothetical protein
MSKFSPAEFKEKAFTCPYCGTYASQFWADRLLVYWWPQQAGEASGFTQCRCLSCNAISLWSNQTERCVYPPSLAAPSPHPPSNCEPDYQEARQIVATSPRGAAALLRLCIQKLMIDLGESGKNINDDIGALVKKGLPVQVQQALDLCRVIGNNAVHPGELNINDTPELANQLFQLINFIVEQRIEQPRRIAEMFGTLPEKAREAIAKRDA